MWCWGSRRRGPATFLGFLAASVALAALPSLASGAIKLGVYSGANGKPTTLESPATLDSYSSMVGRQPDIALDYSNLTDPLLTAAKIANIQAHPGVTPMITWQLYKSGWSGATVPLAEIAAGKYDSYLHSAATLAKAQSFPIMIRFAHEMNGDWYGWGGDPTNYVNAWHHVVDVFRADGVSNVSWVWSPNVDYGHYPITPYFPGDGYVDYVALDGYNWGTSGFGPNKWESFSQVFGPSYQTITQLSSKPVIIAETASAEAGGDKAQWIRDAYLSAIPQCFPRVAAVVWYDRLLDVDWSINTSSTALAAYRDVVNSSLYGGSVATTPTGGCGATTKPPKKKRPRLSSLRVTRTVHHRGQIRYRLSSHARVRVVVHRRGQSSAREMSMTRSARPGKNRIGFSRRLAGRRLREGRYRITVVAFDRGGAQSHAQRARFRVTV